VGLSALASPAGGCLLAQGPKICLFPVNKRQETHTPCTKPVRGGFKKHFLIKFPNQMQNIFSLTWRMIGGRWQGSHLVRGTATLDHDSRGQWNGSTAIDLCIGGSYLSVKRREIRFFCYSFCFSHKRILNNMLWIVLKNAHKYIFYDYFYGKPPTRQGDYIYSLSEA